MWIIFSLFPNIPTKLQPSATNKTTIIPPIFFRQIHAARPRLSRQPHRSWPMTSRRPWWWEKSRRWTRLRRTWLPARASRRSTCGRRSPRWRSTSTGRARAPSRCSSRRWAGGSRTRSRSGTFSRGTDSSRSSHSIPEPGGEAFRSGSIPRMGGPFWRIGMGLLYTLMETLRYASSSFFFFKGISMILETLILDRGVFGSSNLKYCSLSNLKKECLF